MKVKINALVDARETRPDEPVCEVTPYINSAGELVLLPDADDPYRWLVKVTTAGKVFISHQTCARHGFNVTKI